MARNCSYCSAPGHNRRTCIVLKHDRDIVLSAAKKRRTETAKMLQAAGFSLGALVEAPRSTWGPESEERAVYIVNKINVDPLARMDDFGNYSISLRSVSKMSKRTSIQFLQLPIGPEYDSLGRHHDRTLRWKVFDKTYVDPKYTCKVLAPSYAEIEVKERLGDGTVRRILRDFNIHPATYRETDKCRRNHEMQKINNFLNPI